MSSASMPRYKYLPLGDGEIRLLELVQEEEDQTNAICCRLARYSIDNLPSYEALSYTWGTDPSDRTSLRTIYVDGNTLEIMPNLEAFLRQLRQNYRLSESPQKPKPIWIDAICINQEDLDERGQQLGMMCRLYTYLNRLVVWLGVSDADSRVAISFVRMIAQKKKQGIITLRLCAEALAQTPSFVPIYLALIRLLERPWFERVWIIQEFVLGAKQNMIFQCGEDQLSLEEMEAVQGFCTGFDWWSWEKTPDVAAILSKARSRAKLIKCLYRWLELYNHRVQHILVVKQGNETSLLLRLCMSRPAKATDPRDKVYATLGLVDISNHRTAAQGSHQSFLKVDYRAPVEEVYANLVKALVLSTKRLNVLLACCGKGQHVRRSWIPDWAMDDRNGLLSYQCGESEGLTKGTKFTSSLATDSVTSFAEDLSTLTIRGMIWDTVHVVSPCPYTGKSKDPPLSNVFIEFCHVAWRFLNFKNVYGPEENSIRSLWRCLLESDGVVSPYLDSDMIALGINDRKQSDPEPLGDDRDPMNQPDFSFPVGPEGRGEQSAQLKRRAMQVLEMMQEVDLDLGSIRGVWRCLCIIVGLIWGTMKLLRDFRAWRIDGETPSDSTTARDRQTSVNPPESPESPWLPEGLGGPSQITTVFTPKLTAALCKTITEDARIFLTTKGYVGKDFSLQLRAGDLVCILLGCPVPVALRQVKAHYEVVWGIYVDGIMYGEGIKALERGNIQLQDFELH